jgi:asparagine N-glycosylation enzyme membrane subunit Stt3
MDIFEFFVSMILPCIFALVLLIAIKKRDLYQRKYTILIWSILLAASVVNLMNAPYVAMVLNVIGFLLIGHRLYLYQKWIKDCRK